MRWRGGGGTSGCEGSRSRGLAGGFTSRPRDFATPLPLLEQRVERLARVVGRLRLARLVVRQVPDHFGLEERAFVAPVLVRHAGRDVLAALPHRGGVEEAAVAAGVDVGA